MLVRIADFPVVRRSLGVAGAEALTTAIADRIAALLPDSALRRVGRATIEVGLTVTSRTALDAVVTELHDCPQPAGLPIRLRLAIGAAMEEGGCDDLSLIEAAEAALTDPVPAGGRGVIATGPAIQPDDVALGRELRLAVERGELFLQYQPKLHLRRQAITSIEALIRWRHPARGLVLPNDFIPAAERSGAIRAMTLWTLRQVTADQKVIRAAGHELPVFVNIAGVLLSDVSFIEEAAALIVESGVTIGFEITETSVIRDPQAAITNLQRLADIGVAITIDDYGAGLSSLAYLKQLPARELKIDKLFVTQLASSHRDPLIVRSTIDLAHALEMEVVAEGVETPTSLALLSVMGCDMVQGYLISRPLVLEHLLSYLRDQAHRELLEQSRSPLRRLAAVRANG